MRGFGFLFQTAFVPLYPLGDHNPHPPSLSSAGVKCCHSHVKVLVFISAHPALLSYMWHGFDVPVMRSPAATLIAFFGNEV